MQLKRRPSAGLLFCNTPDKCITISDGGDIGLLFSLEIDGSGDIALFAHETRIWYFYFERVSASGEITDFDGPDGDGITRAPVAEGSPLCICFGCGAIYAVALCIVSAIRFAGFATRCVGEYLFVIKIDKVLAAVVLLSPCVSAMIGGDKI